LALVVVMVMLLLLLLAVVLVIMISEILIKFGSGGSAGTMGLILVLLQVSRSMYEGVTVPDRRQSL